mgnify:CR=1 FL=1
MTDIKEIKLVDVKNNSNIIYSTDTKKAHRINRALNQLMDSLKVVEKLKIRINNEKSLILKRHLEGLPSCQNILTLLEKTLHKDAPVLVSKGKVIAEGFSEKLDHLRNLKSTTQAHLDGMLERESDRTKIPSLNIWSLVRPIISPFFNIIL